MNKQKAFVETDPFGLDLLKFREPRLEINTVINGTQITISWSIYGYTLLKIGTLGINNTSFDHYLYFNDFYPERKLEKYTFTDSGRSLEVRKCIGGLEAKFTEEKQWQFLISDIQIKVLQKQTFGLEELKQELNEEIEEAEKEDVKNEE